MKDKEQEQITPEIMQMNAQMNFTIMQIKMNLLALAKDMAPIVNEDVRKLYLELREEVIGIPDPNTGQKEKLEV